MYVLCGEIKPKLFVPGHYQVLVIEDVIDAEVEILPWWEQ